MSRKKTNEEFKAEVYELVKDEYRFKESYINAKTPIEVRHNKCGHTYKVKPNNFISKGTRCPNCNKGHPPLKRQKVFDKEVLEKRGTDYTFIEPYQGDGVKIKVRHNKCGNIYKVRPYAFLRGDNCPRCSLHESGMRRRKTHEEFMDEISSSPDLHEYEFLSRYVKALSHIEVRHKICGHEYEVTPNDFIRGSRCPRCIESLGEKKIRECLDRFGVDYIEEYRIDDCRNIRPLPFDFAIFKNSSLLFLIEYDGRQHFNESDWFGGEDNFLSIRRNDGIKNSYCKENHIDLIRIPYWEYENIESILDEQGVLDIKEVID